MIYELNGKAAVKSSSKRSVSAAKSKTKTDQRKEFLTKLGELAEAPGVDADMAADRLGMTPAAFSKMLSTDAEAGRIWRHAKTDALIRAGNILWTMANNGNTAAARQILESLLSTLGGASDIEALSVKAIADLVGETKNKIDYWYRKHGLPKNLDGTISLKPFLEWYRNWLIKQHTFDPNRVKLVDLEPLLGVSRQAINEWLKDGLPRNSDKTFSLPAVYAWRLEQIGKRAAHAQQPVNQLAARKARKLQIEIEKAERNLLERSAVEVGWLYYASAFAAIMDRKEAELPALLADCRSEEAIAQVLHTHMDQIRQVALCMPEELAELLPEEPVKKLQEYSKELNESRSEANQSVADDDSAGSAGYSVPSAATAAG